MYTAALIRRQINQIKHDKPFSIRDFLNYGSRNAIDQVFHRLVKSGQTTRIARGLFIKDAGQMPSIFEVALAKAKAFRKILTLHGSQAAQQLKIHTNPSPENEMLYACSGPTSSFRFGALRIRFISSSQRKIALGNDIAGLTINALGSLGKATCNARLISDSLLAFKRKDRQRLRQQFTIMPTWLACYFITPAAKQKPRLNLQAYFHPHR